MSGPIHGESSKHHYAPVSITKWTRRRDRLMDELRAFSADVYCLQEVSEKGLAETFIPGLLRIGLHCFGALEMCMITGCFLQSHAFTSLAPYQDSLP